MLLLIYFVCLLILFNFRKAASPGLLLIFIYVFSLLGALLIGSDYKADTGFKAFNMVFLAIMLSLFILPWNLFKYKTIITEPNPKKLYRLTVVLLCINGMAFLFFSIICYYTFTIVLDYSAFKNGGGSGDLTMHIPFNHTLFLIVLYLHSTSYFLVPIHFYYLNKKKYFLSILALIFSLNILLQGLTVFSRSGFANYLFLYFLYIPFFYPKLATKTKNFIKITGVVIFSLAGTFFYIITQNRFAEILMYNDAAGRQGSTIKDPAIYSVIDYLSQWFKSGNDVMATYSFKTLNGEISFPLFYQLIADQLKIIPYKPGMRESMLYSLWRDHFDHFNGIIANLVFDFGYLGASLFVLIYVVVLLSLRPVGGKLSFAKLLMLGMMFILPAMGIFNTEMASIFFNLLIVYAIIVYLYLTGTKKKPMLT
jgi:hypothetical protein